MPQMIDLQFFAKAADDEQTIAKIEEIYRWQEKMVRNNEMRLDTAQITLSLRGRQIVLEAASAVNALEIYQEMFQHNYHGVLTDFVPDEQTRTVVDLGANYGFFALWVKEHAPDATIICVEPNKYVFPFLEWNLRHCNNCIILNKAVSNCDGRQTFDFVRQVPSIAGKTLSQIERSWLDKSFIETQEVETVCLERLFKEQNINSVDILKVDIEGSEKDLFDSLDIKAVMKVKRIVVEWHSEDLRKFILSRMDKLNFELLYDSDPVCNKYYGNLFYANRNYIV